MRTATEEECCPKLAPLKIRLFYKHAVFNDAGHGLTQHLLERIQRDNPLQSAKKC